MINIQLHFLKVSLTFSLSSLVKKCPKTLLKEIWKNHITHYLECTDTEDYKTLIEMKVAA